MKIDPPQHGRSGMTQKHRDYLRGLTPYQNRVVLTPAELKALLDDADALHRLPPGENSEMSPITQPETSPQ